MAAAKKKGKATTRKTTVKRKTRQQKPRSRATRNVRKKSLPIKKTTKREVKKASAGSKKRRRASNVNPEGNLVFRVKYFEAVPNEYAFLLADGSQVRSLLELSDALLHMSDDLFGYHVTEKGNDFARWVYDVIGDEELASMISLCHTRHELNHYILRYLINRMNRI